MGEPEETREHLEKKLRPYRYQLNRLIKHIDHMDQPDLDEIQQLVNRLEGTQAAEQGEILKRLRAVHAKERCQEDMEREGSGEAEDPEPTVTSRGRQLWEGFKEVNRDLRRRSR